jgi:hypothetical protein
LKGRRAVGVPEPLVAAMWEMLVESSVAYELAVFDGVCGGNNMALLNLYSRRKYLAEKRGDDVYNYDKISPKLRNQILFVIYELDSKLSYNDLRIVETVDV